jgi:site-specific recombinase XerD
MAKLKQVSPGFYQTPDYVWTAALIDDPELKRQAHRLPTGLPTDPLWSLFSVFHGVTELHPSLPACRERVAEIERQHGKVDSPSQPAITTQAAQLAKRGPPVFPPVLACADTPAVRNRVESFFSSVASMFESWVLRSQSPHTQRAYREGVMAFVRFRAIVWPEQAIMLFTVPVSDVVAFRDQLAAQKEAPKTINRRISSLSSFYKYLAAAAAELRLPITVPNPAQAQFLSRQATDSRDETKALSAKLARQLMELPAGDSLLAYRDRAILKFFLYSGARLSTACRLKVSDFHLDGDESIIRLHEKGDKGRTIGLHGEAAQAIAEYIQKAGLTRGPLFRPRLNPRSQKLGSGTMAPATMYRLVEGYLQQLPGAARKTPGADGTKARPNLYTPHSLRATTATLLLDAGVDILKVQELLGHRHVTTTQVYDKRRRSTSESASHKVRI